MTTKRDDIRPKGTVEVQCSAPGCEWWIWIQCADPRLPDGPFWCGAHDPNPGTGEKEEEEEPPEELVPVYRDDAGPAPVGFVRRRR